jgi:ABC-type spermidine/putrescine transport system permease subunit II
MTRLGQVFLGMILIFLYTPIFVIMAMGFNESELYELPFKFSTRWYSALSTNTELLTSGFNSIVLAVITAILATAIGTLAALALSRRTFRGRSLLQLLLLPPIAIPWLITGTAC